MDGDGSMIRGMIHHFLPKKNWMLWRRIHRYTLQELADMLHMDKFYLIKEFSRYVGVSPHEYQIGLRLSYAKELLKYSDLSVTEIAYACGVNQTSHFISLFKEREHLTPAKFRKEWRMQL